MKNKSFLIIYIFLLITVLFTSNVFASFDFTLNNEKYSYPDLPVVSDDFSSKRFIILRDYLNTVYLCFVNTSFKDKIVWSGNSLYYTGNNGNYAFKTFYLKDNSEWKYCFDRNSHDRAQFTFLFSTENIYNPTGDVFFHHTPLGITQTLVAETEKAQIMEQIKTMIVGFLKYLIVLVISVIAFYKGWKFLSTQLRKS